MVIDTKYGKDDYGSISATTIGRRFKPLLLDPQTGQLRAGGD